MDAVENILAHHGVLGMRWGRRSGSAGSSSGGSSRKDKKFEKRATSTDTKIKLYNATNPAMNKHIERINAKPIYVKAANNGTLSNNNHPTTRKYHKEYMDAYEKELNNEATRLGTNSSGTRKYHVTMTDDSLGFTVSTVDVKHDTSEIFTVKFVKDDNGVITGFVLEPDSMTQSSNLIENILAHHGKLKLY